MSKKTCSKCKVQKDFKFFSPHPTGLHKLQSCCKECRNLYSKQRRLNPEKKQQDKDQTKVYLSNPSNAQKRKEAMAKWKVNNKARHSFLNQKRKKRVKIATPFWANAEEIYGFYELCAIFARCGLNLQVDHIVPIQSKQVCGLHVTNNLRLITAGENQSKGNRYWPDMMEST